MTEPTSRQSDKADKADTVLITGASSGIGEALAGCFASAGMALVLVARRADKLEALAKQLREAHPVKVTVLGADLTEPGAVVRLAAALKRRRITVDVLVNNAGVMLQRDFVDAPPQDHHTMIDLNVSALTALLAAFLPGMKQRGHGRVLNVASIAAFQPVPSLATYAATKAYVLSLTESLSEELRGSGVTITALCPGFTATPMFEQAAAANSHLARIPPALISDVNQVAAEGFAACMRGEVVQVAGVLNRAATIAGRALPKWLVRHTAGLLSRQVR